LSRRASSWRLFLAPLLVLLVAACEESRARNPVAASEVTFFSRVCEDYPPWETAVYNLPYDVGRSFLVINGNCSTTVPTHSGRQRYAYDLLMPTGTRVLASRAGNVSFVQDQFGDQTADLAQTNIVEIRHQDGTYAHYDHFTAGGVAVQLGQFVEQGARIGWSGASGTDFPHLHFDVHTCGLATDLCDTVPVTFQNTIPNPEGLQVGEAYPALF